MAYNKTAKERQRVSVEAKGRARARAYAIDTATAAADTALASIDSEGNAITGVEAQVDQIKAAKRALTGEVAPG